MRSRINKVINDIEESVDVAVEEIKGVMMELDDGNVEGAKAELSLTLEKLVGLSKELY